MFTFSRDQMGDLQSKTYLANFEYKPKEETGNTRLAAGKGKSKFA